jgi:hypothetical protein
LGCRPLWHFSRPAKKTINIKSSTLVISWHCTGTCKQKSGSPMMQILQSQGADSKPIPVWVFNIIGTGNNNTIIHQSKFGFCQELVRVGKNPVFFFLTQPGGFFWVLLGFLGFIGFF